MNNFETPHVLIIGSGAYGKALKACILSNPARQVTLLSREDCVNFQGDISEFHFILFAVPCQSFRAAALWVREKLNDTQMINKKIYLISTAKGIEQKTILLPHQILQEVFQNQQNVSIGSLSGPSFAKEMMEGLPTCVVLASKDPDLLQMAAPILHSSYFRIYDSNDILGVEIGGALKNVIAMVAGAVDGLNLGNNARAAVMTRGLSEIAKIGAKLGANPITFMGLSGLGDLILTCTGDLSRNRTFGYRLAKGEELNSALYSMGGVVEGMATTQSAYELTQKLKLKSSILNAAYEVLYNNLPISQALENLINGQQSTEFHWIE